MIYRGNMTKYDALNTVNRVKKWNEENKKKFISFEKFAAESIMTDIMDRRGIKRIFEEIYDEDRACYNDIKKTWEYIIKLCFDDFMKDKPNDLHINHVRVD